MPLYDFLCEDCEKASTLLLKSDAAAACPHCGSAKMLKQFAPFAITAAMRGDRGPAAHTPRKGGGGGHVHTSACSGGRCGAAAQADSLIKKYLG